MEIDLPKDVVPEKIDPKRLEALEKRIRGDAHGAHEVVEGFSGFSPPRGNNFPNAGNNADMSNLTTDGSTGNHSLVAVCFEQNERQHSNASCATVQHANKADRDAEKIYDKEIAAQQSGARLTFEADKLAPKASHSKRKTVPAKRPVSSISSNRHITPCRSKSPVNSTGGPQKKARASKPKPTKPTASRKKSSSNFPRETAESNADVVAKQCTDSRSESRDTLNYYFGASTASNQSRSQLASPPALQSKVSTQPAQKTLHSFLGIADNKNKASEESDSNYGLTDGTELLGSGKSKTDEKRKRQSLSDTESPSQPDNGSSEVVSLRATISELQRQLQEATARNNSIKNNQTMISTNLQRQLKHQKAELERVRQESTEKLTKATECLERLVREEGAREGKDLRQKLASDSARLGRLVTSRIGGGIRTRMVDSWEDGHAPRALKERRVELKHRRNKLEKERDDIELRRAPAASSSGSRGGRDDVEMGASSEDNQVETPIEMTALDRIEARETVKRHLDQLVREEADLDKEERAMHIEKRKHVQATKLVNNEESSKFKGQKKLHGRYVLLNLLGKGGFSEVWRAFDLMDMRNVAVKIHQVEPSWSDAKKENYTKHVSREYEIHRTVRHPRIVSLFDVFEIDDDAFATVLECCKGTDLSKMLQDRGRLPERDARAILLQILSGMRYLSTPSTDGERPGIIHYDLKPGNVLFDEDGNAKITDFGLSKIVETEAEGDSMELTSQGAGTYWYLPPECFMTEDDVRISNKVDVWSIGVIYFQMLYGRRPFGDGETQDNILKHQIMLNATEVSFPPKPITTEGGKQFIRDCLTYDQSARPTIGQLCNHRYLESVISK